MEIQNDELEKIIAENLSDVKRIANKYFIVGGSLDDLVQEGMIGLIDGIRAYDSTRGGIESDNFKSFILMCAKRQILDAIKKDNSKKNSVLNNSVALNDGFEKGQELGKEKVRIDTPEDIVMNRIEQEETANSISIMLSKFEKSVLNLYLEGCKQSEIALQLNKSIKSVDNTLQRIKNKIKGKG